MKKLIICAVLLFLPMLFLSGCVSGRTNIQEQSTNIWTSDKPDKEESASVGFDYIQGNNNFMEDLCDNHLFYYDSIKIAGFDASDPENAYLLGPFYHVNTVPSSDDITGRSYKAGDVLFYGTNYLPIVYDGASWLYAGNYLKNYTTATRPTCDSDATGLLIFDTTEGTTYECNGSAWTAIADAATAGVTTLTGDSGSATSGAVTIEGGTGITTSSTGSTVTVASSLDTSTFLAVGAYQELPGVSLWLDSTSPPSFSTATIDSSYTIPVLEFSKTTTQIVYFTFDVPKDWKTDTNIIVYLKGYQTTVTDTDTGHYAAFDMYYKHIANAGALSSLTERNCGLDTTSFPGAAAKTYRMLLFTISYSNIGALGTVVGKFYRYGNHANDTLDDNWTIVSVAAYYQKKNN